MNFVQIVCLVLAIGFFLYSAIRLVIAIRDWRRKKRLPSAPSDADDDIEKGNGNDERC